MGLGLQYSHGNIAPLPNQGKKPIMAAGVTTSTQPNGKRAVVFIDRLPTAEQYRKDEALPWRSVRACAAGNIYDFQLKVVTPVRWKAAGAGRGLLLLIVRPLFYRLRQVRGGSTTVPSI